MRNIANRSKRPRQHVPTVMIATMTATIFVVVQDRLSGSNMVMATPLFKEEGATTEGG